MGEKQEKKKKKKEEQKIHYAEKSPLCYDTRTARMYASVIPYDTTAAARWILSCKRTRTTRAAARQTDNDANDGQNEL